MCLIIIGCVLEYFLIAYIYVNKIIIYWHINFYVNIIIIIFFFKGSNWEFYKI